LAALTSRSELALELDGGAGLDGDGAIGDSTGITIMRGSTAGGTTPGAGRFITGAPMLVADLHGAVVSSVAVVSTTGVGPDRSTEIGRQHEDTLLRTGRAGCGRAPSEATTTEDRPGAFRRAAAPALGAGLTAEALEGVMAAEADGGKSKCVSRVCRL
jgi:hypothetical protein